MALQTLLVLEAVVVAAVAEEVEEVADHHPEQPEEVPVPELELALAAVVEVLKQEPQEEEEALTLELLAEEDVKQEPPEVAALMEVLQVVEALMQEAELLVRRTEIRLLELSFDLQALPVIHSSYPLVWVAVELLHLRRLLQLQALVLHLHLEVEPF